MRMCSYFVNRLLQVTRQPYENSAAVAELQYYSSNQ